ncbi:MAG TPA: tetratricopeptide repeat protein, partial [Spirochaetia bacterium]|nr:tetratricopeptide repeat protein [Spirochaetia bacterium]
MRFFRALFILLLLVGRVASLAAQTPEPSWLTIKRAERLMEAGEFGLAIRSFRTALDLSANDPLALFGLGRAYKAIGDFPVAEDYLSEALRHRQGFDVPEHALLVRYARADLYRTRRDFVRYEEELFTIIAEDPIPDEALIPDGLHLVLAEQGIDRMLVLYRLGESGATDARGQLAELLVGLGRYDAAAEQGAVTILQAFTTMIEAARRRDPTYDFSTVEDLVQRSQGYPEVSDYLERSSLYRDIYYTAAAYYGEGRQ